MTVELATRHPADFLTVAYENLRRTPELMVSNMFRFLGVSDASGIVADCVARASFVTLTGGRESGDARNGLFLRKGVVGDWPSTLTPEMNALVLRELGWMFSHFGWNP